MKIFLDSGNLNEIKSAYSTGLIDGITTNPSIIAKESNGKTMREVIKSIVDIAPNISISAEVLAQDYDEMLKEALALSKISENVCVKLPITRNGLTLCKELVQKGIDVNMTLCFSLMQAVLCAKLGARYVSPFIGRLEDTGQDGIRLISDIKQCYDNFPEYSTEIIAASVRNMNHLNNAAKIGVDIVTISYQLFASMHVNPLSDIGLKKFIEDSKKIIF